MAKFKSILVEKEEIYPNGQRKAGKVAWVPENDAAKITDLAKSALATGHWVPKDPNEIEKAQARLQAAEEKENKRRGM